MATMATTKRRSLGRGLGALLGQPEPDEPSEVVTKLHSDEELQKLPVDLLQRGKYQPRIDMRPETLQELADSIKAQGVVQPRARATRDTRSSPVSVAGAPRSSPACTRFRPSCAAWATKPRSRWRSSRTSSART
jgi:hypothetical protein